MQRDTLFLQEQLIELQTENQRLNHTLKAENKMKQELLTAYHNLLKEITDLNATLTNRDYQILDLTSQLDRFNPSLYSYASDADHHLPTKALQHDLLGARFNGSRSFPSDGTSGVPGPGGGGGAYGDGFFSNAGAAGSGPSNNPWPPSSAAGGTAFVEEQLSSMLRLQTTSAEHSSDPRFAVGQPFSPTPPPPATAGFRLSASPPPADPVLGDGGGCSPTGLGEGSTSPPVFLSQLRSQLAALGASATDSEPPDEQANVPSSVVTTTAASSSAETIVAASTAVVAGD